MTTGVNLPAPDRIVAPRRLITALAAIACASVALLAGPGTASANDSFCDGFTRLATEVPGENMVLYRFRCTDAIAGYTIVSRDEVTTFGPEGEVQNPLTGAALNGESYSCEGTLPGHGIVCNGKASGGNVVQSTIGTAKLPCSKASSFYLSVADAKGAPAGVFDLGRPRGCAHALAMLRKKKKRSARRTTGGRTRR